MRETLVGSSLGRQLYLERKCTGLPAPLHHQVLSLPVLLTCAAIVGDAVYSDSLFPSSFSLTPPPFFFLFFFLSFFFLFFWYQAKWISKQELVDKRGRFTRYRMGL